ncbi:hypothetical protein B0H10DRAFT_2231696 [Mycena sp. CBHHK59/15]|nr:hypothetical protein B0H10DRAFT_2231696 [Mycena sp. CBHHK59/15]
MRLGKSNPPNFTHLCGFKIIAPLTLQAIDPNCSLPHKHTCIDSLNVFGRGLTTLDPGLSQLTDPFSIVFVAGKGLLENCVYWGTADYRTVGIPASAPDSPHCECRRLGFVSDSPAGGRERVVSLSDSAPPSYGDSGPSCAPWLPESASLCALGSVWSLSRAYRPSRSPRPRGREVFDVRYPYRRKERESGRRKGAWREGLRLPHKIDPKDANRSEQLVPIRLELERNDKPIRTHRTPAIGFPELDAATLAAASAPMSRCAAVAAASLMTANMVASENGGPTFTPQSLPSAPPPPPVFKEKTINGFLKPLPYDPAVLRPRARVPTRYRQLRRTSQSFPCRASVSTAAAAPAPQDNRASRGDAQSCARVPPHAVSPAVLSARPARSGSHALSISRAQSARTRSRSRVGVVVHSQRETEPVLYAAPYLGADILRLLQLCAALTANPRLAGHATRAPTRPLAHAALACMPGLTQLSLAFVAFTDVWVLDPDPTAPWPFMLRVRAWDAPLAGQRALEMLYYSDMQPTLEVPLALVAALVCPALRTLTAYVSAIDVAPAESPPSLPALLEHLAPARGITALSIQALIAELVTFHPTLCAVMLGVARAERCVRAATPPVSSVGFNGGENKSEG